MTNPSPRVNLTNLFGTKILSRQLTTIQHNFNPNIFWGGAFINPLPRVNPTYFFFDKKNDLSKKFSLKFFLPQFFLINIFFDRIFLQTIFRLKNFFAESFFHQIYLAQNFFSTENFFFEKSFRPTIILFLTKNILFHQNLIQNNFIQF